jgi:hypothetical protein
MTEDRLFGWHAALFPTGYSRPYKIKVGAFRDGEMRVVSEKGYGAIVHYEAPPPGKVQDQNEKDGQSGCAEIGADSGAVSGRPRRTGGPSSAARLLISSLVEAVSKTEVLKQPRMKQPFE